MSKQQSNEQKKEQIRLIIFATASTAIIMLWGVLFPSKQQYSSNSNKANKQNNATKEVGQTSAPTEGNQKTKSPQENYPSKGVGETGDSLTFPTLAESLQKSQKTRIKIRNDLVEGSINLAGGTIDDLRLQNFRENMREKTPVALLLPRDTMLANYIVTGWVPIEGITSDDTPNSTTVWQSKNKELSPGKSILLTHSSSKGIRYEVELSLDSQYMLTVKQSVLNNWSRSITLQPFAAVTNNIQNPTQKSDSYQGPLGFIGKQFQEVPYKKLLKAPLQTEDEQNPWLGISGKYWLSGIHAGTQGGKSETSIRISQISNGLYQTKAVIRQAQKVIAPKEFFTTSYDVFVGPKSIAILDQYSKERNIPLFSRAIDLGRIYFITKPLLILLKSINLLAHNYGVSIILMTVLIRLLLIPLANKSFKTINKMKSLAPQIEEIKKTHKEKRQADIATLELYKKEKINPLAGFVPLLLQIPVFFALYKALYVAIELRHSVFVKGWIEDLSSPDPTSFVNLFGLLPFKAPQMLQIGVLPIIMGITMWLQQRTSSMSSLTKEQAKVVTLLPFVFVVLFSQLPAGLILYWIVTNTFSIVQDYLMRKNSAK